MHSIDSKAKLENILLLLLWIESNKKRTKDEDIAQIAPKFMLITNEESTYNEKTGVFTVQTVGTSKSEVCDLSFTADNVLKLYEKV